MANTTRNIWNDDDGERVEKKTRHPFRHFLIFFLVLVVVLGVVVFAAYRDGTGFDVLRRYLTYSKGHAESGEALYDYDASANNRFAVLGEHLVVLSDTRLRILNASGGEVWSTGVSMKAPALVSSEELAVAYDVGGTELYVVNEEGLVQSMAAKDEQPYIAVTVNKNGYLAVTAEKKGYKGCVGVYDEKLQEIFAFNSSSRFVTDAYVMDDNTHLAAVTLGQESGTFVSNVVLYNMKATAQDAAQNTAGGLVAAPPIADYDVRDGLVLAIDQQGDSIAAVSDTCLTFAGADGALMGTYSYEDHYLREYDLDGEGFTALLLNRYQSGSVGRLVTVGPDGAEIAALDVNQEVLGLSAAGRYLAVLYDSRLVIYNQDLQVYASLTGTDFARDVLVRTDGSALLLSSEYGELFLP